MYWTFLIVMKKDFIDTWYRERAIITKRLKDSGAGFLHRVFSQIFTNRMNIYTALHLSIIITVYYIFGTGGLRFIIVNGIIKGFNYSSVNYSQHYGLTREKDEQGIYESISLMIAWNTTSSHVFFRSQRHSDHHAHAYRPY